MTPDDLVEIEQIHQLKYRYVRCIDTKRGTSSARCSPTTPPPPTAAGRPTLAGRPAIMEFLTAPMADESMLTSHKVHQPEITLTGPDAATGVWALDDVVIMDDLGLVVRGASFYDDRYAKVDGAWLHRPHRLPPRVRGDRAPLARREAHRQLVGHRRPLVAAVDLSAFRAAPLRGRGGQPGLGEVSGDVELRGPVVEIRVVEAAAANGDHRARRPPAAGRIHWREAHSSFERIVSSAVAA